MALKISIHAPPRGATDNKAIWDFTKGISIHAPPRGATRAARTEQPHPLYFNSRPSARGDIPSMNATRRGFLFQFTPLREGRRAKPRRSIGIYFYFNSRPSARGDGMKVFMKESLRISIHAPPRGATTWTAAGTLRRSFQFTPLREGRPPPESLYIAGTYFNSRPSARGDGGIRAPRPGRLHFNSRPSARGDCADVRDGAVTDISIHAPPRGATSQRQMGLTTSVDFNSRPSARGDEPAS